MARGVPIAAGEKLAELLVTGPDGTTDVGENFFAERDITGTPTLSFQSIALTVTSPGTRHAKIVLDSGRGDSRTFTFEPNFTASQP